MNRIIQPTWVIQNADMSTDIVSEPISARWQLGVFIQLIFTGDPVGDFFVETSLNYNPPIVDSADNATWSPLRLSPSPTAAGEAADHGIDITITSAPWIRIRYAATSGSGTLNAYLSAK